MNIDGYKRHRKNMINSLKAARKFLSVDLEDVERPMLAAFSKSKSYRSSHFKNSLSQLKTEKLVIYPSSGKVKITEKGLHLVGFSNAPVSDEELQENWKNLMSGLQKKIFNVLLRNNPSEVSREEVAGEIGSSSSTSSHFKNSVSNMKTMGAIIYPNTGMLKTSKNVFIGEQ